MAAPITPQHSSSSPQLFPACAILGISCSSKVESPIRSHTSGITHSIPSTQNPQEVASKTRYGTLAASRPHAGGLNPLWPNQHPNPPEYPLTTYLIKPHKIRQLPRLILQSTHEPIRICLPSSIQDSIAHIQQTIPSKHRIKDVHSPIIFLPWRAGTLQDLHGAHRQRCY
jgi:hypothetical protein